MNRWGTKVRRWADGQMGHTEGQTGIETDRWTDGVQGWTSRGADRQLGA